MSSGAEDEEDCKTSVAKMSLVVVAQVGEKRGEVQLPSHSMAD